MDEMDDQVVRLFGELIDLPEEQREGYLNEHCADPETRERVTQLLGHHEALGEFMADKAVDAFPEVVRAAGENVAEFKLIREIGRGGMGVVYLAEDTILGRTVALKMISGYSGRSEQTISRFRQEAKAAGKLSHPGIVSVYRFDDSIDPGFIAMEYVDGHTLEEQLGNLELLQSGKSEPGGVWKGKKPKSLKVEDSSYIRRCVEVTAEVAEALDWAHQQGVIHRDIKPSNILIDQAGKVKITDFGIAMILESPAVTQDGQITGTYGYMSPEQIESGQIAIDHRTDVYSLGIVLYEMLTQKKPFTGENPVQILKQMHSGSIAPVHHLNSVVDKDLETICLKAIETDPANRYQSSAHLMADLRSWLRGEPILARPPSHLRKLKEKLYTRRSIIAGSVACASGIAAGSLFLSPEKDPRPVVDTTRVRFPLEIRKYDFHTGTMNKVKLRINSWYETYERSVFRLDPGLYRFKSYHEGKLLSEYTRLLRLHDRIELDEYKNAPADVSNNMVFINYGISGLRKYSNRASFPLESSMTVSPFWIDQYETTCAEYAEYVQKQNVPPPALWGGSSHPKGWERLPVSDVTWREAQKYAEWRGKRLPTVQEWVIASMGPEGQPYPWGISESSSVDLRLGEQTNIAEFANINQEPGEIEYNGSRFQIDGDWTTVGNSEYIDKFQKIVRKHLWDVDDPKMDVVRHSTGKLFHLLGNVSEWTESTNLTSINSPLAPRTWWKVMGGRWSSARIQSKLDQNSNVFAFERRGSHGCEEGLSQIGMGFRCAVSAT